MASLTANEVCLKCGSPLGGFAPGALCARCLLKAGLSDSALAGGAVGGPEPATVEPRMLSHSYSGRYEVLEEIGHGGMGVVYRARDTGLNRVVALKMILAGQFAGEREVRRFRAEAEAVGRLDHPNIVPIYDVGDQDGRPFYSMKFMEGGTLTARLASSTAPLDPHEAASLLVKVARAVHHAHQRAILHRDLKPGNILLDARGEPHVSDFGLAKCLDDSEGLTLSGTMLGSPSYMSPEQAAGQSERLTTASDTYSLGALLYHLLTGRPPFEAATPLSTLEKVLHEEPPRPGGLRSGIGSDLEIICLKCLEKEPSRRYGSAEALAEDLERWLGHQPIQARPVGAAEPLAKWMRRNPRVATLVLLLNLVFLIGVGGILIVGVRLASANRAKDIANKQLAKNVRDFEWQKIDELSASGKRPNALAYLVSFLRQNPNDTLAATRLISMMSGCNFVLPAAPPLEHGSRVNEVTVSRDGKRALTAADDNKIRIWNLANGALLQALPHTQKVVGGWVEPDESLVLTSSGNGAAWLWELATKKILLEFPRGSLAAISRDCRRIAVLESQTTLQVWDLAQHQRVGGPLQLPTPMHSATFDKDDRDLAVVFTDGTVRIWKTEMPEKLLLAFKVPGTHTWVEFSPDGKLLASADGSKIAFWNRGDGALLNSFSADDGEILEMIFAPDGSRLATMVYDRQPRLWKVPSGQMLGKPLNAEGPFPYLRFSPDGKKLATFCQSGASRVWDAFTALPLTELFEHEGPIRDQTFTPDGRFIVTGSQDGTAQLWDARAGLPDPFALPTTDIYPCACFSRDGGWVYRTSNLQAEIFDLRSGQRLGQPMPHSEQINRMELSPDGKKLATAGFDNIARIWDAETGAPLAPPLKHAGRVYAVAFSPDGKMVATGSLDLTARCWDAVTGQPIGPALSHQGDVMHVQFSLDGRVLLTASVDGTARRWSVPTDKPLV